METNTRPALTSHTETKPGLIVFVSIAIRFPDLANSSQLPPQSTPEQKLPIGLPAEWGMIRYQPSSAKTRTFRRTTSRTSSGPPRNLTLATCEVYGRAEAGLQRNGVTNAPTNSPNSWPVGRASLRRLHMGDLRSEAAWLALARFHRPWYLVRARWHTLPVFPPLSVGLKPDSHFFPSSVINIETLPIEALSTYIGSLLQEARDLTTTLTHPHLAIYGANYEQHCTVRVILEARNYGY